MISYGVNMPHLDDLDITTVSQALNGELEKMREVKSQMVQKIKDYEADARDYPAQLQSWKEAQANGSLMEDPKPKQGTLPREEYLKQLSDYSKQMKGKLTQADYDEQMPQTLQQLQDAQRSLAVASQAHDRLEKLAKRTGTAECFVIPSDTSKDELKKLREWSKVQSMCATDSGPKAFFAELSKAADSCLIASNEKGGFETKKIPLLASETIYANLWLASTQNQYDLDKDRSKLVDSYLEKLENLSTLRNKSNLDTTLSEPERGVLHELYNNTEKEIKTVLQDAVTPGKTVNEARFKTNMSQHVDKTVQQANNMPITSGFKGMVNSVCSFFNKSPVFTAAVTQSMKERLQGMLAEQKATAAVVAEPEPEPEPSGLSPN